MRAIIVKQRLHAALLAAPVLLSTQLGIAGNRVHVWYDHSLAPSGYSRADMHALINQAIMDWEQHSHGTVIYRFQGDVNPGEIVSGSSTVTIRWANDIGTDCGRTYGGQPVSITLNPAMWGTLRTLPVFGIGPGGCGGDALGVLMHEMAHLLWFTTLHYDSSVLSDTTDMSAPHTVRTDRFSSRHVWNNDMYSISETFNPRSNVSLAYDEISASGTLIRSIAVPGQGTGGSEYENFSAGVGMGPPGFAYSRVATHTGASTGYILGGLYFEVNGGDLVTWTGRRELNISGNGMTLHHACVVADTSANVYVVAANRASADGTGAANIQGSRTIQFAESHDGGNSWSLMQAIPGPLTREGVSCGFDMSTGRVVVGILGTDDRIYTANRIASAVGVSAWSGFSMIDAKETVTALLVASTHPPRISFDPFTPASGVMTWFDWMSMSYRIERVVFNSAAGRYEFQPPAGTTHPLALSASAVQDTRGPVVPSVIGSSVVPWGFTEAPMWCPSGGCARSGRSENPMLWVWRRTTTSSLTSPVVDQTTTLGSPVAQDFQRFEDSATSRLSIRNLYERYVVDSPL